MMPDNNGDAQVRKNHALYVAIAKYFPKVMIAVVDADFRIVFMEGEELQKIGIDKVSIEGEFIKEIGYFPAQWKKSMISYAQKTFEGGTGPGLPIVKKYIDLMQGDISVESQLDKGTTFTITLPLQPTNHSQA